MNGATGRGRQRWFVLGWLTTLVGGLTIETSVLLACFGVPLEPLTWGVLVGIGLVGIGLVTLWASSEPRR